MSNKSTTSLIVFLVLLALLASALMFYQNRPADQIQNPKIGINAKNETIQKNATQEDASAGQNNPNDPDAPMPSREAIMGDKNAEQPMPPIGNPNDAIPAKQPLTGNDQKAACANACQTLGYETGHCNAITTNSDQTINECADGEYPYNRYPESITVSDCYAATEASACCCKGEPQNPSACPAINRPEEPVACIEQPGYLKNPKTGECCWYEATCYGPDGWEEFSSKNECLQK